MWKYDSLKLNLGLGLLLFFIEWKIVLILVYFFLVSFNDFKKFVIFLFLDGIGGIFLFLEKFFWFRLGFGLG